MRAALSAKNRDMANDALRVLAAAEKRAEACPETDDAAESGLCFLGLIGLEDPPRPEAAEAVSECKRAGIRPVMITGDQPATASAIAGRLGIENKAVMTGAELESLSDDALLQTVQTCSVYARVSPAHKMRIIKAFRRLKLVTAMTGDKSGAVIARVQPMKLAAMEALYDGQQGAPLTAIGIVRPEAERTSNEDAFYFKIDIPKLLSIMSFRDADAYVAGINDLVNGNEKYGVMSAAEKMERGRVAVGELARYRAALEAGDQAAIDQITAKFDPSKPEGEEFLREYFAYFGYGYLDTPQQVVPNVPLLFYSFRVMVGAGCFFILLLGVVWWLNRRDRLASKRWLLRTAVWSVPLAYLASQAGWIVAEVGRQPWAIQDLMPVGVAASKIPSGSVSVTFFLFLALFTALLVAELSIMFRQIKIGPKND